MFRLRSRRSAIAPNGAGLRPRALSSREHFRSWGNNPRRRVPDSTKPYGYEDHEGVCDRRTREPTRMNPMAARATRLQASHHRCAPSAGSWTVTIVPPLGGHAMLMWPGCRLDESCGRGQTQAGSVRFGGEECVKIFFQDLGRDAWALGKGE